jgi:hypothetical protein
MENADMSSNIEEILLQRLRTLPVERQVEGLDFAEFLGRRIAAGELRRRDPIGMFADLGLDISARDIDDARSELWRDFPRDFEL